MTSKWKLSQTCAQCGTPITPINGLTICTQCALKRYMSPMNVHLSTAVPGVIPGLTGVPLMARRFSWDQRLREFSAWLQCDDWHWPRVRPGTWLPDLPGDLLLRAAQFGVDGDEDGYAVWLSRVREFPVFPDDPITCEITPRAGARGNGAEGFTEDGEPAEWDMALGTVLGYRSWGITAGTVDQPPYIVGNFGSTWIPRDGGIRYHSDVRPQSDGRYRAVCQYGRHDVPFESCGCGFWAYWDLPGSRMVTGVIEGSGRVIAGERGFRCQYARILALAVDPCDGFTDQLRELYGVPVFDSPGELQRAYGADPNYGTMTARYPELARHDSATLELYAVVMKRICGSCMPCPRYPDDLKIVERLLAERGISHTTGWL